MDEDRIGLVLARASELRLKITKCIQQSATPYSNGEKDENTEQYDEEDSLLTIKDALEALESQISSLQVLQQQQCYEKEIALAEIESSQKKLFKSLKEYKGKDLEVIHEASAFVGETDDTNDLLLPPYPTRGPGLFAPRKFTQNGPLTNGSKNEFVKPEGANGKNPINGVKNLLGAVAKAVFTVAGVICVLSLAGFEPRLKKRDSGNHFTVSKLFRMQENGTHMDCPPGKIPVMEDGEIRCLVKERVEVPFESVVATPDVNYGCG